MQLDRCDLADLHHPSALARKLHDLLGQVSGAVPVVEIARALDIQDVRLDRFDGFEGMLLTDRVRSTGSILANTRHGSRRARFTVAHELGHFLMERHQLSDVSGFRCRSQDMHETREGRQDRRQEAQANQFASDVLAPAKLVMPLLSPEPELRDAQRLRDHLDLSLEVCVRRMITLRPEALAAVWSQNGTVRYALKGEDFPYVNLSRGDRLPTDSQAHRATRKSQRGTTKSVEAHPFPWTDRSNLELHEQTRIGADGHAVTLLWATLPDLDDEDEDDGGLSELGMPRFR